VFESESLKSNPDESHEAAGGGTSHPLDRTEPSVDDLNLHRLSLNGGGSVDESGSVDLVKRHGMCLALSDHDRIKTFISEFLQRGLVPYAERTIKILNEQIQSKKSILKSFSIPRKFFGGSSSTTSAASVSLSSVKNGTISTISTGGNNAGTASSFVSANDELQLRRLADLAFMFRFYDLAYSSYHSAKKEFSNFLSSNNSQTSSEQIVQMKMYLAGALEMATVVSFMQNFANDPAFLHASYSSSSLASSAAANTSTNSAGSMPVSSSNSSISSLAASVAPPLATHNKTYQLQYIDEGIGLYANECKNVYSSVRSVLLSTEALRATSLFLKAAYQFINLANEETDVRTALFLEQASLCYLAQSTPLIRKYAFFMALAGHRFNKAGQVI
jgi:hypothetical protein